MSDLPYKIDSFLQSIGQYTELIDYGDIIDYSKRYDKSDNKLWNKIMKWFEEEWMGDYEEIATSEMGKKMLELVKGNVATFETKEMPKKEGDKLTLNYISKMWKSHYGENFRTEYSGLAKKIGKQELSRREFFKMWKDEYGENFREEYSGLAKIL